MRRTLGGAGVTLGLALGLAAQASRASAPSFAEIALLLDSREPAKIAWGAHHARDHEPERYVPHLRKALGDLREHDELPQRCAALQVLDALWATGAVVTVPELEPFLGWEWTAQVALALLARAPAASAQVFAARFAERDTREPDCEWLLAGDVLTAARAPGFAFQLLRALELRLTIRAVDATRGRAGIVSDGRSVFCCATLEVPEGFPTPPCLELEACDESAPDRLALPGVPVRLTRGVASRGFVYQPSAGSAPRPVEARLVWLAALLGTSTDALGLAAHAKLDVVWTDAAQFTGAVQAATAQVHGRFRAVLARLREAKLLRGSEAAVLTPQLEVRVEDLRADRSRPLRVP